VPGGELNERIGVQMRVRTSNGQGGYSLSWQPDTPPKRWAKMQGMSGDEAVAASVERSVTRWRVTVRRRPSLTAEHRLTWKNIILDVKAVLPHPRWDDCDLLICESGATATGI
jgi:head-tail adaptor